MRFCLGSHSYKAAVTEPTCKSEGYTTYTCTDCGHSYTADYKDIGTHREGEGIVITPATKYSEGVKTILCRDCGKLLRTEVIPVLSAAVEAVSIADVTMNYKSSKTLTPEITADDGAEYTVSYSSDSKSVTVDENGKLYAAKKGSASITVTVTDSQGNTVTDTCRVTVDYAWWQWIIMIVLFGWLWY